MPALFIDASTIGVVGLVLYSLLLLLALQRLYRHCWPLKHPYFSTRKVFHQTITCYALLQTLSFATFTTNAEGYTKWSYSCHLFAVFFELCSFSFVAVLWSKSLLSTKNARRRIIPSLLLLDLFFFVYITTLVTKISISDSSFFEFISSSTLYQCVLVIEPVTILINALIIIYLGIRITRKLSVSPNFVTLPRYSKRAILFKLIGTMSICCTCYLGRACLEIYLFVDDAQGLNVDTWYILNFIVSILPALLLIYTMRRTTDVLSSGSTNSNDRATGAYFFRKLEGDMVTPETRQASRNIDSEATVRINDLDEDSVASSLLHNSAMISEEDDSNSTAHHHYLASSYAAYHMGPSSPMATNGGQLSATTGGLHLPTVSNTFHNPSANSNPNAPASTSSIQSATAAAAALNTQFRSSIGATQGSISPYKTYGQGGNFWEANDEDEDILDIISFR